MKYFIIFMFIFILITKPTFAIDYFNVIKENDNMLIGIAKINCNSITGAASDLCTIIDTNNTGNITGSGAINNISIWTTATNLGSSILYQNNGFIGIGTVTPSAKLDIAGKLKIGNDNSTPIAGTIRWTGTNFEGYDGFSWKTLDVQAASGGGWTEDSIGNKVYLTNSVRNVGIGTADPLDSKLTIGAFDNNHISLLSANSNYGWKIDTADLLNGNVPLRIFRKNAGTYSEVMRITQGGSVGIGTTDPKGKLTVVTGGSSDIFQVGDSNVGIELRSGTTNGTPYIDFSNDASTDYDARIRLTSDDYLVIEDANVGIGTTTPKDKLDVNGGAIFNFYPLRSTFLYPISYGVSTGAKGSGGILFGIKDVAYAGNYRGIKISTNRPLYSGDLNKVFDLYDLNYNDPVWQNITVNETNPITINITFNDIPDKNKDPFVSGVFIAFGWRNSKGINFTIDYYQDGGYCGDINYDNNYTWCNVAKVVNNEYYEVFVFAPVWRVNTIRINFTAIETYTNPAVPRLEIATIEVPSPFAKATGYFLDVTGDTMYGPLTVKNDLEVTGNTYLGETMKLKANTTPLTCNINNEGIIYYDGTQKKHFGCNGTVWMPLY